MAIRKRGQRWQVDVYINKKRVRENCATKAEALARQAELLAIKAGNEENPQAPKQYKKLTLSELLELTTARYWAGTKSELVQYKTGMQIIKAIGPNTLATDINLTTIDAFISQCKTEGNAAATINRKIAVLQKMLRYAHERGYISSMPRFERMKTRQGRIRYLSYEEEEQLLLLADKDLADFILLAIETGGRRSEIFKLKPQDILDNKIIFSDTKNGKTRSVPLTRKAKAVVQRRLESAGNLWPTQWTTDSITQAWAKLRKQMDLEHDTDFVFHCTRHTCATRLLRAKASLREVQHWLGHSNITQTAIYAHLEEDAYYSLAEQLDSQRTKP
ncbi:tyrosine-type recombinase/integrase [Spartinivicinus ruber]|uniref:tyrosine-type recombinase/integrase n=1 Tax=Spartinivicinus ruber TaxID=2683272 RepID=UPI0013D778A8|nr:site-specific integrase [Spartinivicinus ruber]